MVSSAAFIVYKEEIPTASKELDVEFVIGVTVFTVNSSPCLKRLLTAHVCALVTDGLAVLGPSEYINWTFCPHLPF